jgi:hypothetical protein
VRRAAVLPLAAVVSLLPACSGGREGRAPTTTTPRPPIRIEAIASVDASPGIVGSVVTWERYVGWTGAATPDDEPNQVLVHDLDTRTTRVIARSRFGAEGTIPRFRASRDTVVYVDLDRMASDVNPRTKWRMYSLSVSTGEERLLGSSTSVAEEEDPSRPSVAWPWVVWFQATGNAHGDVMVRSFDLRDGRYRTLVPATFAGQLSIDDTTGTVYYDTDNGSGGRDVFAVPADGSGAPRRVTTSGLADFPIARNGGLVWQHPPGADSESLWYQPVTGGRPQRFSQRSEQHHAGSNAFPGRGFVVWSGLDGLMAGDFDGGRAVVVQPRRQGKGNVTGLDTSPRWWVEGNRVAWAMRRGFTRDSQSTVHVAVVRS